MKFGKVLFIVMSLLAYGKLAAKDFVVNLPKPLQSISYSDDVKQFFTDIYKPIGVIPNFVFVSSDRSFRLFKQGIIHAEGYRASIVGDPLGRNFRLDTPVSKVKVGLFCLKQSKCNVISGQVYAIQAGFEYAIEVCSTLGIKCKHVDNQSALARLIDNNLTDAVISPYPAYDKYLCLGKHENYYYRELVGLDFNIYHYTSISDKQKRKLLEASLERQKVVYSTLFARYGSQPDLSECNKRISNVVQNN